MRNFGKLAVATLLLLVPAAATAQSVGATLGVGYYIPTGNDYKGYDNAVGFDGRAFARFGVGIAHIAFAASGSGISIDIPHWELYAEPRFNIPTPFGFKPFLGARLGWIHQSMSLFGVDASTNGVTVGATAGGTFAFNRAVGLELALLVAHHAFGDTTVGGVSATGSSFSGQTIGLRAGLRIGLP
jgi:hypothetical protein